MKFPLKSIVSVTLGKSKFKGYITNYNSDKDVYLIYTDDKNCFWAQESQISE